MAWTSVESRAPSGPVGTPPSRSHRRHLARWCLPLLASGLVLSACSLHVSKHGISGNVFGHSFSGASGQLPTGFPSDVPVPDHSRVLVGGGTDNDWDVGFAVTGSLSSGTTAYQDKLQSAGYAISNVETGSTTVTSNTAVQQNQPGRIGVHGQERPVDGAGRVGEHVLGQGQPAQARGVRHQHHRGARFLDGTTGHLILAARSTGTRRGRGHLDAGTKHGRGDGATS